MTLPTIHMNGTAIQDLIIDNETALSAVRNAMTALARITPNQRDYYPNQDPRAWASARDEHEERTGLLKVIERDLMTMQEYLYGQQELRRR